jgi:RNA polymerase sigma-70 factor (ECF subfamily)
VKDQTLKEWEIGLVHRAQAGEVVAFGILADMYRPQLRQHAMRMLRDPEDASDVVQDALIKAFRAIGFFQSGRPLLPWLIRILSNCCVDQIRHRKGGPESLERHEYSLEDAEGCVHDQTESRLGAEAIRCAIGRLPARYRDILVMRHFRHMNVGEIAKALGKPEGTVKSWLFRASVMLRKELPPLRGATS